MIKKYYIFTLTILCLLVGQSGFGQNSGGDDYGWEIDLGELCVGAGCPDYDGDGGYNPIPPEGCNDPCFCFGDCPDPPSYCEMFPEACYGPGGNPGTTNPDPNQIPNPCTATSIAAGVAATNLFKNSAVSTTMSQMPILFPSNEPPYSQQLEHGFNIKKANGIISTTPIREGTANGLPAADYTPNVIADLHDHPAPGAFAPSAQDLFALDAKRDAMSGFKTSYVSSSDGNIYALYIEDPNKLNAFVNNNPGFVGSDNNFKFGTAIGDYWLDVYHDLQRQGYTLQEAYTRATTLILKDAGVSLLKTDAKTIDFKKIDIEVVGDDPNGNTIIIINDCK